MSDIVSERSGHVLSVKLNRPAKKNAMTSAMYLAMAETLAAAAQDDEVRVVLWYGAGDSFSAGNDIEDFVKNPPGPGESPQARLMHAFIDLDKPLIAAVQGLAIGGGTTMLGHCDVVYAGANAKFQIPFVNLALVPEFGSSYLLPQRVGYFRAAELILLGKPIDATRAAEIGLVTEVVPDGTLMTIATEAALKLAEKPTAAVRACKRLMKSAIREPLLQAIKLENEEFAVRVRSDESKAAFQAFFSRRQPQ
jgi:enoyl-CoA hydratase/carnithine racemase